jgi:hypothetical protein
MILTLDQTHTHTHTHTHRYNRHISQFSKGDYANATNQEDDLAIITEALGLEPDNVGATFYTSAFLKLRNRTGTVSVGCC